MATTTMVAIEKTELQSPGPVKISFPSRGKDESTFGDFLPACFGWCTPFVYFFAGLVLGFAFFLGLFAMSLWFVVLGFLQDTEREIRRLKGNVRKCAEAGLFLAGSYYGVVACMMHHDVLSASLNGKVNKHTVPLMVGIFLGFTALTLHGVWVVSTYYLETSSFSVFLRCVIGFPLYSTLQFVISCMKIG